MTLSPEREDLPQAGTPRHHPPARPPKAYDRLHPRLTHRDREGELLLVEGTLIRLQVEHLPGP